MPTSETPPTEGPHQKQHLLGGTATEGVFKIISRSQNNTVQGQPIYQGGKHQLSNQQVEQSMSPPLKPISEDQLEDNYPVKPFMPASSTQSKFFPSQPSRNPNGLGTQKSKPQGGSRND